MCVPDATLLVPTGDTYIDSMRRHMHFVFAFAYVRTCMHTSARNHEMMSLVYMHTKHSLYTHIDKYTWLDSLRHTHSQTHHFYPKRTHMPKQSIIAYTCMFACVNMHAHGHRLFVILQCRGKPLYPCA
jgi:hypothetical protein